MKISCHVLILAAAAVLFAAVSFAQTGAPSTGAAADTSTAGADTLQGVQLRVDTAFAYCALEMTGSYEQHSAAFEKLYTEAMQQGIYGGTPFGIYFNNPIDTPVEKLSWDVGFVLPAGQTPKEPLKLKRWEFTTMAVLEYSGEFGDESMTNAYNELFGWIGEHGYRPAGPMMEAFLNIPSPNEQGTLVGRVEIIVPIEKIPAAKDEKAK